LQFQKSEKDRAPDILRQSPYSMDEDCRCYCWHDSSSRRSGDCGCRDEGRQTARRNTGSVFSNHVVERWRRRRHAAVHPQPCLESRRGPGFFARWRAASRIKTRKRDERVDRFATYFSDLSGKDYTCKQLAESFI
jgi:hypothetical protein